MSTHVSKPGWEKDTNEIRRAIVREMNRLGAYRLEGHYSGGHDEGGLEYLNLFDKKGEKLTPAVDAEGNPRDLTWDDPLWTAVDDLLSTKFYTWALGESVYGDVFVDLKEKKAWTEGRHEVTEFEDDTDPISLEW